MKVKIAVVSVMAAAMVFAISAMGHEVTDVALGCGGASAVASGFASGQYQITAKVWRDDLTGTPWKTDVQTIVSHGRWETIPFSVSYDGSGTHDWRVVFSWFADGVNDSKDGEKKGLVCSTPTTPTVTVTTTQTVPTTTTVATTVPVVSTQMSTAVETITGPTETVTGPTQTVTGPGTTIPGRTITVNHTTTVKKTIVKTKWRDRWHKTKKTCVPKPPKPDKYPCKEGERYWVKDGKCHKIVRGFGSAR